MLLRYRLRTLLIVLALAPPLVWFVAWPLSVRTKEPPASWKLAEIADAAPPRSDRGPVHVLAWKIVEDDRPLRVEYCLVLKQLAQPTQQQERWSLASLVRVPSGDKEWDVVTWWMALDPEFKTPPLVMHQQHFRERPTNSDIYAFMDKCNWRLGADADSYIGISGKVNESYLIDGGIGRAWPWVIGQRPTRSFPR